MSTTALNAYSGVKNTLIHLRIDVVGKTSQKKKMHVLSTCLLVDHAVGNNGTKAGILHTKIVVVTRPHVFFCTILSSFGTITDQKDITN